MIITVAAHQNIQALQMQGEIFSKEPRVFYPRAFSTWGNP